MSSTFSSSYALYISLIFLLLVKGNLGTTFTLVNKCEYIVWPGILSNAGSNGLNTTGFLLQTGATRAFHAQTGWSGRFWGRTGCSFDPTTGQRSCVTGDCGSNQMECNVSGATPPATLAEFGIGSSAMDFYDISLVNGYNLPMTIEPVGGSGNCSSAGCVADLNRMCPNELRTGNGQACMSPCNAFGSSAYCCTGAYSSSTTCQPTVYAKIFKNACPKAYSYLYDDATSIFTCSGADYTITFCPSGTRSPESVSPTPGYAPQSVSPGYAPESMHPELVDHTLTLTVVGICLAVGIIILFISIFYFLKRRRRSRSAPSPNQDVENFLLQNGSLAPKRYKYSEMKKITKSFKDKLGQGGYGNVYKGMLPDGRHVAVKVLIETDSNGEEFMNEVASISRTSHVNIVSLLGFCYDKKMKKRALVYEYMPNKSLDKFISNSGTDYHIDGENLYKIAIGVAKGLEYLHTGCNTRIVHFDIKPQNILLDEDLCPKISDFGLAKLCKKKQSILSVIGTRGTIGYIAPEVFSRNFGGVSHKSDVYSYGMMVLEMAGAKKIVGTDQEIQSSENYFPDKLYEHVIMDISHKRIEDLMIEDEEDAGRKMFMVGFWCIQTNPSDRPSMCKVVEMLEGNIESIQIPPKPVLFAPPVVGSEFSSSLSVCVETENSAES